MTDITRLSARDLVRAFRDRELGPVEALDAFAARIEETEPSVNAFTTLALERARAEAEAAEASYLRGEARPLEGVPVGIKDMFDTAGVRTTYGSSLFADHVPEADAEVVRRLRAAGAVVVGKTGTHEFAWGITTVNPHFGPTRNPWALDRVPGGSSGGSGAALAVDAVPLALGSDTGGSIRIPAAFCGVVGLKPTYGRVSGAGGFPLAPSLDHPGPMARTPGDAALVLSVIAGFDPADPTTEAVPVGDLDIAGDGALTGSRVAVSPSLHSVPLAPDVEAVWTSVVRLVQDLGAEVVEVELPSAQDIYRTFGVIQRAEARRVHERRGLYPARRDAYAADVRSRLEAGAEVTLPDYLDALDERRRVRAAFARLFDEVDLLLTPVSAGPPLPIGDETVMHLGREIAFRDLVMVYTTPQDLVGFPACAVRAGFDSLGIPVGVQFTGPPWHEARVLAAAAALYEATPAIQARRPPLVASQAEG